MIIDKCTKQRKEERFNSVAELQKFINNVYYLITGASTSQQLDNLLLRLSSDQIGIDELINLGIELLESNDKEKTETFFSNISAVTFRFFENTNLVLLQGLVKSICKYWNQGGWPFSYIDLIADCGSKIFKLSDDVEIKTDVLFLITDLAIYYNRWYAMGIVRELFKDVRADVALQTNLAMRLSAEKLQLGVIFADEGALPPLIADIYKV